MSAIQLPKCFGSLTGSPARCAASYSVGLVEEPLHLQLRVLRKPPVGAAVPDPEAHLKEADRVAVAEVEVREPGLDERGHDRELLREPALLGLPAHPGGELRLRGVVARVAVGPPAPASTAEAASAAPRRPRPRRRPRRPGAAGARLATADPDELHMALFTSGAGRS